jgi:hypothetical protein
VTVGVATALVGDGAVVAVGLAVPAVIVKVRLVVLAGIEFARLSVRVTLERVKVVDPAFNGVKLTVDNSPEVAVGAFPERMIANISTVPELIVAGSV